MTIREIELRAIRGIRHSVALKPRDRGLMIVGDNGTGKTSIERGLRWALTGEGAPTGEAHWTSETSFRAHVLEPPTAPSATLKLSDGGEITCAVNGTTANPKGQAFRDSCRRASPFLCRTELIDVLSTRPIDRFKYFESFLHLEESDAAFRISADLAKRRDEAATVDDAARDRLLQGVRSVLPPAYRTTDSRWASVASSLNQWSRALGRPEEAGTWSEIVAYAGIAEQLGKGDELAKQRIALANAQQALADYAERAAVPIASLTQLCLDLETLGRAATDASVATLLRHAQLHFEASPGTECPVCRKPVNPDETLELLRKRLSGLTEYNQVRAALESAAGTRLSLWQAFRKSSGAAIIALEAAGQPCALPPPPTGADLLQTDELSRDGYLRAVRAIGEADLSAWTTSIASDLRVALGKAITTLPAEGSAGDLRILAGAIRDADAARTAVAALEASAIEHRRVKATASAFSEAIRKARQDVAQELLATIGKTVVSFYNRIHPPGDAEEATSGPTIKVQRSGQGQAFIRGTFNGKEVADPRWVYSDGHLDTVAICIFLGLRRFRGAQKDDCRLLVLDDVVLSIDLSHGRRLIELLRDDFADHQIIVLTHNGLFAYWLSSHLPGMGKLALRGWSIESGPQVADYVQARKRLEGSLTSSSQKDIAMAIKALMDEWTFEARFIYGLAVPAKYGEQYTLGEIWPSFTKMVRDMEKSLKAPIGTAVAILKDLEELPRMRNALAAHENEFAKEYPLSELVRLGTACLSLLDNLYCAKCESFVRAVPTSREPSMLHCSCHSIQYVHKPGQ
jgi:hypothetical protein